MGRLIGVSGGVGCRREIRRGYCDVVMMIVVKKLANLELLLVWEDDPKLQWFPWNSSFRSIEVIHRYFEENQMRKFIPPEFTWGKDHPEYIPRRKNRRQ